MIKLIGIVIVILGFIIKLDTITTVLVSGILTGFVAGMGVMEVLTKLGEAFVYTRFMSIFLVTLPVIGILEKNGLREVAAQTISKIKSITIGNVLFIYTIIRVLAGVVSLRVSGHVQFIRPIIYPMVESIAKKEKNLTEKDIDTLKAISAASDNYGNFYGQNLFVASAGVLLIFGTLKELGITNITTTAISISTIPISVTALILAYIQYKYIDKQFEE